MKLIDLSYLINCILDNADYALNQAVKSLELGKVEDVKAAFLCNFNAMPADLQYFLREVEKDEPRKNAKNVGRLRNYFSFA
jgi:hypothetical protein